MVEIRYTQPGGDVSDFLNVVTPLYKNDPCFVRSLDMDLGDRLHPKRNPFFEHGDAALFTAYKGGKCVGRVSASIDRDHLARHNDGVGFFGFFDTVDDPEVARMLLSRAEGWLRAKGMKRIRGPVSLSINEELGCLVNGFDTPPYLMMPHHFPYQARLIEGAGFEKAKDFFAWSYEVGKLNTRTQKAHDEMKAMPEVTSRRMSQRTLSKDIELLVDVFNDAWSENWGFVPFTRGEQKKMTFDLRLILIPEITCIVSIGGEPAAVALAIPNINELSRDLDGQLLPTGGLKLAYRLKVKGPKSARLILLGIRKKWRHARKYAGLSAFMYAEMNEGGASLGIKRGELGWTLEDNGPVNAGIRMMGGKAYKTYRVFEKAISS